MQYQIEPIDIFMGWGRIGANRKTMWRVRENGMSVGRFDTREQAEQFVEEAG